MRKYSFSVPLATILLLILTQSNAMFFKDDFLNKLNQLFTAFFQKHADERVYLHTDKTLYKPGETIWFEAYLRNESNLKPSEQSEIIKIEFINPKGNIEKEYKLIARNGRASGDIALSSEIVGGLYKLKAYTNWQLNHAQNLLFEKEITVQKVVLPNLRLKLDFEKEAYGAGAEVVADVTMQTLANQPLSNYDITFTVSLEGKPYREGKSKTDEHGKATLTFSLPAELQSNDGLLNVLVMYNGQREAISRSIPIKLGKISLEFLPEGGEMLVGMENRIAFRALDEFGKPADVSGVVLDAKGNTITEFASYHNGMGSFLLTPKAHEKYTARLIAPSHIATVFQLPEAIARGYTLSLKQQTAEKMVLTIKTTEKETLYLVAQMRGQWLADKKIQTKAGTTDVEFDTRHYPMGVVQVTLFDSKGIERAERLVFVNSQKQLQLSITTDKEKYLPREKVTMTIGTTDERGIGIPAQLSLAVVDDKLLSFADDKQGHILAKLLLEPDLKGKIHEPNFYFDTNEKKAPHALDLLMMTHGWRKFTWQEIQTEKNYTPTHEAEKAVLRGIVLQENRIPVRGAKILLSDITYRTTIVTDDEGRFVIPNYDLYEPVFITAEKKGIDLDEVFVDEYGEEIVVREMIRRLFYKKSALPTMGERMREGDADADAEKFTLSAVPKEKPLKSPSVQKDVVPAPPAADEVTDISPDAKVSIRDEFFNNPSQQQPNDKETSKYYRARVFPKVVYSEKDSNPETRTDFRTTIHWQGNIQTDKNGKTTIEFYNNDDITTFRAIVEGVGIEGSVGRKELTYFTQKPFSMNIKIPVEMTMGDVISLPLTLSNFTNDKISGSLQVKLPQAWKPLSDTRNASTALFLSPQQSTTIYLQYEVLNYPGKDSVRIAFDGGKYQDAFSQEVHIASKGFPVSIAIAGQEKDAKASLEIQHVVEGTLQAKFTVYPSVMSDLLAGVESILREPYGCFEQTSSSCYPNIMVLRYLKANEVNDPQLLAKAHDLLDKGYKRLITFETKEKGYEWFGGTPPHEALTAYGLMEFNDMSEVYASVDRKMLQRTADWLFSRKDGKGGFLRDAKALDSFGRASEDVTNAYIVYALSEAGYIVEIKDELEKAYRVAQNNQDPYQMALVANALFNVKDGRAESFLTELLKKQKEGGFWEGTTHSITYSTGLALKLETTSLGLLAAMKSRNADQKRIGDGVKYLVSQRSAYGGYGNTQSTVLVLKALTAFANFSRQTAEDGEVTLKINGNQVEKLSYTKGQRQGLELIGLEKSLPNEGKQTVQISYAAKVQHPLPYVFAVNYSTHLPPSSAQCKVSLKTSLASQKVKMGETVRLSLAIANKTQEGLPMTIAIVGIPAGLSVQPWQLKELQEKQVFDFYEIIGNRLALYYRQMKPAESKDIHLDLKADIPGTYEGTASCAYLYYTNEFRHWVEGVKIEVAK